LPTATPLSLANCSALRRAFRLASAIIFGFRSLSFVKV
jgi:hypothetical protein